MKTGTFALLAALLLPPAALAALTDFQVQVTPARHTYAQGDTLHASASADGAGMEYRYMLWRLTPTPVEVLSTAWSPEPELDLVTGDLVTPSGKYRLLAVARETAAPAHKLEFRREFNIAGTAEITAALQARHQLAADQVRDALRLVIKRLGTGNWRLQNTFFDFQPGNFIAAVLKADREIAPGGGPAFVAGQGDAGTGAIGVDIVTGPANLDQWTGTEIRLHLPAYSGMAAATLSVSYENALSPEQEQAQRDLVVARYNEAISRTTAALLHVIRKQGFATDLVNEYQHFADSGGLISSLLNVSNRIAPRAGNAYVDTNGGNADTGAIGAQVTLPPVGFDDWWGTTVKIDQPAFLGLPALSTTISYDTVLPEAEAQAQRDKVLARYSLAIGEVQKTLREARDLLAAGGDTSAQFDGLADGNAFIAYRLWPAANAPRGGPAWVSDTVNTERTGAIGIEVITPASPTDWHGTEVRVSLPAFLGLAAASTTITFAE